MITSIGDNIKWEKSDNVIPLYTLALRWPHDFPAMICFHIHNKDISLYECVEYSKDVGNNMLCKLFRLTESLSYEQLVSKMPNLFFRWQEVDSIERNHPEYRRAVDRLLEQNDDVRCATPDNLSVVVASALFFLSDLENNASAIQFDLVNREMGIDSGQLTELYEKINISSLTQEKLRPVGEFGVHEKQPLTTFEKAKLFIAKCVIKDKCDKLLALIELDRRFPELTSAEVGSLLPANKDAVILEESMEKHCLRLRKEAYKYSNIKI